MVRGRLCLLLAAGLATGALMGASTPSSANPATTASYAAGATANRYLGYAFDACTAPPLSSIQAWRASPYRALAVYVGGLNRTCAQPELTAGWVRAVSDLGWRLLPVYKGLQPACGARPQDTKIAHGWALQQGTAAATDAVRQTLPLGMRPGSGIWLDIENFSTTDSSCAADVLSFISGYTHELHRRGYLAGVYANLTRGAGVLSGAYGSSTYSRPDALWIARWDGSTALTNWAGVPNSQWAVHQRAKQFHGDHQETYGGVTLNIDSNRVDGPVATVSFPYTVTGSAPVTARRAPSSSASAVATHQAGSAVDVVCQAPGTKVGSSTLWDKLADGSYISTSTASPAQSGAPAAIRCYYPFQVTPPTTLAKRTGPGASYAVTGTMPPGALAWLVCQRAGSKVGGTSVWDRLDEAHWVTDYYVATPSATGYSPPIPHC